MDLTQISLAFPNVEQDGETASSDRNLISHFLLQKSLKCQNICVVIIIFSQTFVATTMQPELSIRSCKKYNYLYSTNLKSGLLLTPFCWKKKLQFFSCGFEVFTAVLLLALFAKETFWCATEDTKSFCVMHWISIIFTLMPEEIDREHKCCIGSGVLWQVKVLYAYWDTL